MSTLLNAVYSIWNQIVFALSGFRVFDLLDILVVAYIIYKAIGFARETRAGQLVKGIAILLFVYLFADGFNLPVLRWLLGIVINSAIIVLVVIFQPELRRTLEKLGSSHLRPGQLFSSDDNSEAICIENVCKAAGIMSNARIGALIVFERKTQLGDIINTGTVVDAVASVSLIDNIFFPKSRISCE